MALNTSIRPFNYGGGEYARAFADTISSLGDTFANAIYRKRQERDLLDKQRQKEIQDQLYKLDQNDYIYQSQQTRKNELFNSFYDDLTKAYSTKEKGLFKPRISDEEDIMLRSRLRQISSEISDMNVAEEVATKAKDTFINDTKGLYDTEQFANAWGFFEKSGKVGMDFLVLKGGDPFAMANSYSILNENQIKDRTAKTVQGVNEVETFYGANKNEQLQGYDNLFNDDRFKRGIINDLITDYDNMDDNEKLKLGDQMITAIESYKRNKSKIPENLLNIAYQYGIETMGLPSMINSPYTNKQVNPSLVRQARQDFSKKPKEDKINWGFQPNVQGISGKQGDAVVFNVPSKESIQAPSSLFSGFIPEDISNVEFVKFKPNYVFKDGTVQGILEVPEHEKEITKEEYDQLSNDPTNKIKTRSVDTGGELPQPKFIVDGQEMSTERLMKTYNNANEIISRAKPGDTIKTKTKRFNSSKLSVNIEKETTDKAKKYYKSVPRQDITVESTIDKLLPLFNNKLGDGFGNYLKNNGFDLTGRSSTDPLNIFE